MIAVCILCASMAQGDDAMSDAKRKMSRMDKNGNGTFEKQEDRRQWNRISKLDKNGDEILTIDELSKQKARTLQTSGETKLNVQYKQVGKKKLHLDLYYPTKNRSKNDTDKCPVIVYTHGGGWAAGSKQGAAVGSFAVSFQQLLDHGFCVVSVDYRLYSKDGTVCMRDCVVDCKDAVRYLAKNSDDLGVDPDRFYSFGDSAGGQLSQMLLLTSPESFAGDPSLADQSYTMVAGVSWYGPCDFEDEQLFNHDDRDDFRDRFGPRILPPGSKPEDKRTLYREMSPVNYLSKDSPPLLMIQGDKDTTIPVKHAYRIEKEAKATDAPVQILIVKNAGHNWRRVDADILPTRDEIVAQTVAFFVKHSK